MAETAPLDLQTLSEAVRAQLLAVDGIGQVHIKRGGWKTWLRDPRPARNHWEIIVRRGGRSARGAISAYGGSARFQSYEVLLEGFLPFSYENPDTTPVWNALLMAIGIRLEENMTLGGEVWNAEQLEMQLNDFQAVPAQGVQTEAGEPGERLCHFCRCILVIETWRTFDTT